MTKDDLLKISNQLSCPEGESGVEIGNAMNESNKGMISNSIKNLNIENENSILEIGHGNCRHLPEFFDKTDNIKFSGIEISEIMINEAKKINQLFSSNKNIIFKKYNGEEIPFKDNSFDKILTVNTIYFFENPTSFFKEINRVLKNNGILIISYVQKSLMKKLPFITPKFKLFDDNEIEKLAKNTGFVISEIIDKTENAKSKDGKMINRKYSITILKKQYKINK